MFGCELKVKPDNMCFLKGSWCRKHHLTIQLLHREDVVPAQHQTAAQFPVIRRHQSVTDRGVFQSESVSDLMGRDHEQIVSLVSVQRPPLGHVEVGFPPARQEGVSQSSS